ncbi:MAG: NAD(P)-dependent oxidoreductase [Alphaproteobacteria bacterium]|nr:NAD(P)-dependent oxidoreductase [Alphaproteobacteria bacterium]
MKKAIVFGGSGFIGSHVVDALTKEGIQTTVFDIVPSAYLNKNQIFIQGDILDSEAVCRAIEGQDYVYHLAGQPDIEIGFQEPQRTLELNIVGTTNILEACRYHKVERFLFASTIYVYSNAGGFYRVSKQACELIIEEYQKNYNVNYTILRYGSLYGPRADDNNLIHRILKQAILEKKIEIGYSPDEKRDYIHVYDAARMSVDLLAPEHMNTHVMLTGHQPITRGDLLAMICEMLGGNIEIHQQQPEIDQLHGRYKFTPYVFKPQVSKKILSSQYMEFGQGLLNCMEEVHEKYIT